MESIVSIWMKPFLLFVARAQGTHLTQLQIVCYQVMLQLTSLTWAHGFCSKESPRGGLLSYRDRIGKSRGKINLYMQYLILMMLSRKMLYKVKYTILTS